MALYANVNLPRSTFLNRVSLPLVATSLSIAEFTVAREVANQRLVCSPSAAIASMICPALARFIRGAVRPLDAESSPAGVSRRKRSKRE
ncbi:MAG: hypothetical protein AB7O59_08300 [Pirellulales bacterium]